jgi:Autographiviridae endonuclease VII
MKNKYTKLDEQKRSHHLKKHFGITLEQYQKMLSEQKGLCAVCGKPETVRDKKSNEIRWLSVDHNHETGEIRKLLCNNCNVAMGHVGDSIEHLKQLIRYLESFNY